VLRESVRAAFRDIGELWHRCPETSGRRNPTCDEVIARLSPVRCSMNSIKLYGSDGCVTGCEQVLGHAGLAFLLTNGIVVFMVIGAEWRRDFSRAVCQRGIGTPTPPAPHPPPTRPPTPPLLCPEEHCGFRVGVEKNEGTRRGSSQGWSQ